MKRKGMSLWQYDLEKLQPPPDAQLLAPRIRLGAHSTIMHPARSQRASLLIQRRSSPTHSGSLGSQPRARNASKLDRDSCILLLPRHAAYWYPFPKHGISGSSQLPGVGAPRSQRGDMGSQPRGPKHSRSKKVLPNLRSQRGTCAFQSPGSQHEGSWYGVR